MLENPNMLAVGLGGGKSAVLLWVFDVRLAWIPIPWFLSRHRAQVKLLEVGQLLFPIDVCVFGHMVRWV